MFCSGIYGLRWGRAEKSGVEQIQGSYRCDHQKGSKEYRDNQPRMADSFCAVCCGTAFVHASIVSLPLSFH